MAVNKTVEQIVFEGVDAISGVARQGAAAVSQLRAAVDGAAGAFAALGVTVGAGAFVALHMEALKATAALDDMSESTGASVEGLSAIQRVMKVGGQDFEGFTGQMGRMIKGLKEGSEEGGKAAAAFAFLDIKTKDANGRFRDTSDIVVDLARKLGGYKNTIEQTQLVQDALGKGAERYLPTLKDIAEGTDLQATTTAKMAAQAELAEKNINRLLVTMQDSRRELVNDFTPAIITFTEKLLLAKQASGGWFAGVNTMINAAGTQDLTARIDEIDRELKGMGRRSQSPTGANVGMQQGMTESFLLQERSYLSAQRDRRLKGLMEGMVDDGGGNIVPAPDKPTLAYKSGTGDWRKDNAAWLKEQEALSKAHVDTEEEAATASREAWGFVTKIKLDKEKSFQEIMQKSADERAKLEDEEEKRATEAYARFKDRLQAQVDAIQRATMTEREIIEDSYRDQERALQNSLTARLISEEDYQRLSYKLAQQKEREITKLNDQELMRRSGAQRIHHQLDLDAASTFFGYMSGLMKTNSRKMFEIGKIAATAEAVINTYRAAIGAYSALAPIPVVGPALGAAAAAAAVAFGIAQVQAIQSQTFGGGVGAVGTFPASPITGQPTGGAGGPGQTTIIKIQGRDRDSLSIGEVRQILKQLNDATKDGGRLILADS